MKRIFLIVAMLMWLAGSQPASAGWGLDDLKGAGTKTVMVGGVVLVWVDRGVHWIWDVAHAKVIHPAAKFVTLGIVDLDGEN